MPVLKPLILICEHCHKVSDDPAMMRDNGGPRRISPPPGWLVCVANGNLDDLAYCPAKICRFKAKEMMKATNSNQPTLGSSAFYTTVEGDAIPPEEESGFMAIAVPQPLED